MYNTILVPLDGSKQSEGVLKNVENTAKQFKSKVILLKVLKGHMQLGWDEVLVDREKEEAEFVKRTKCAESYLISHQERFQKKGIETEFCVEYINGLLVKTIYEVADKVKADAIAIASSRHNMTRSNPFKSIAAGLCNYMDRPLILVPSKN